MKWSIDDAPVFVAVVDTGGITPAATRLGMSKSTVSKSLSRLEDALGVRLLQRNSRNVQVTQEGKTFYQHARRIIEQVDAADAVMSGMTASPSGRLIAALPVAFAREFVAPALPAFHARFPAVELELILTSHTVDIIREKIDVAVVVGALTDSELISLPLYHGRLIWVTTPEYARRHGLGPDSVDPLPHVQICEQRYGDRQVRVNVGKRTQRLNLRDRMIHANDPLLVREYILNGGGVSFVPEQYCRRHLETGELVRVFENVRFQDTAAVLSVIYPERSLMPGKTRVFIDFLRELGGREGELNPVGKN
ncbi:LysR family transcriptional regulator [Marinobacter oulmenensis]|uniref:DNA-binding transcriptional LysR family regulator n=1 Tax=Marinobacter oulmenensis TaxID=643747 RepID=A0A840UGA3_9GAMM|nr:LysR family transcriptional regulator [Marinobacter oulmenensis]MBB5321751.1 DNA-binding transcriptional LysR family regulator [Marinobacter oulmenensis]